MNAEGKQTTAKTRAQEWAGPTPAPHPYERLRKISVSERIEKKAGLSYLSWAFAVDTLLQEDASANWSYPPPIAYGDTLMVFCSVSAFGKTMTAQLPVMDHRNKAIPAPDAFAVNTALQRCLVKAIALHGIGLYIYAGEDLPDGSPANQSAADRSASTKDANEYAKRVIDALDMDMESAAADIMREAKDYDEAFATDVWHCLSTPIRNRLRTIANANGATR